MVVEETCSNRYLRRHPRGAQASVEDIVLAVSSKKVSLAESSEADPVLYTWAAGFGALCSGFGGVAGVGTAGLGPGGVGCAVGLGAGRTGLAAAGIGGLVGAAGFGGGVGGTYFRPRYS